MNEGDFMQVASVARSLMSLVVVVGFSGAVLAAPGPKFEERKSKVLSDIDQRIAKMQEHRACVAGASDQDAMKKCHEAMKAFHDAERQKHAEMEKDRKEGPEAAKK